MNLDNSKGIITKWPQIYCTVYAPNSYFLSFSFPVYFVTCEKHYSTDYTTDCFSISVSSKSSLAVSL